MGARLLYPGIRHLARDGARQSRTQMRTCSKFDKVDGYHFDTPGKRWYVALTQKPTCSKFGSTVTMATIPNQKILCILRAVPARAPWCCELRFTFGIRS